MIFGRENVEKHKTKISKEEYFTKIHTLISEWESPNYVQDNQVEQLYLSIIKENNLSRIKSYCLLSMITDVIYEKGFMTQNMDTIIDELYSRLNGDCDFSVLLRFPEDPINTDVQEYARSYAWTYH